VIRSKKYSISSKFFSDFGVSSSAFRSKFFGDFRGYSVIFWSKFVGVLDGFGVSYLATTELVSELFL